MLRQQLRALILAADGRPISVMFPMVAEAAEFMAARAILEVEAERARRCGLKLPERFAIGIMLEVPALVWQLPVLCGQADFISVGSNDLLQFLFAKDRGNARLADRYDTLAPAALRCLGEIVRATSAAGVPLSICGEMAGGPLEAMALIGLGFRCLSMSPSSIGPVKAMVRSLRLGPLRQYLAGQFDRPDHSLREKLREFARDHGVSL
jgi:phosphotransferase system enzyme I (PtsP)